MARPADADHRHVEARGRNSDTAYCRQLHPGTLMSRLGSGGSRRMG
jgi:hypothetical protein